MTICGYHERMGIGLAEFAEGLVAAIRSKAVENHRTIREQMANEEDQIAILEQFLSTTVTRLGGTATAPSTVTAFTGLVTLCHGLLSSSKRAESLDEFAGNVQAEIERLVEFLKAYERAYDEPTGPMSNSERTVRAWTAVAPQADDRVLRDADPRTLTRM